MKIDYFKRNLFWFIFGGFLLGVVARYCVSYSRLWELALIVTVALLLYAFMQRKSEVSASLFLFAIAMLSVTLGIIRFDSFMSAKNFYHDQFIGREVELIGIVASYPERNLKQTFIIETNETKVLVRTELYPIIKYGDKVVLKGRLKKPENFLTDQEREFDYVNFLKKDGIYFILDFAKVNSISAGYGNKIITGLFRVKEFLIEKVHLLYRTPNSDLLTGILLGVNNNELLNESFRKVGLSHITVLSGYNIAIVIIFFSALLQKVRRKIKIPILVLSVVLFTVMVSSGAATYRAAGMALAAILAKMLGRKVTVWRALLLAVFLMIAWNPMIVFFDPGFQLSFLATSGLLVFGNYFKKKLSFVSERFSLREILATTLSAQVAVLPMIVYLAGNFSIVSLPVNILVLPLIGPLMLVGFLSICSSIFAYPIALLLSLPESFFLSLIREVVFFFGSFSFFSVNLVLSPYFVLTIYIAAAEILIWKAIKKTRNEIRVLKNRVGMITREPYFQNLQQ